MMKHSRFVYKTKKFYEIIILLFVGNITGLLSGKYYNYKKYRDRHTYQIYYELIEYDFYGN